MAWCHKLNGLKVHLGSSRMVTVDADTSKHHCSFMHVGSALLSDVENDCLFCLFDEGSLALASAVVQLLDATPDCLPAWIKRSCGVACLVWDAPIQSYYLWVFDVQEGKKMIVHDLRSIIYSMLRPYFLAFQVEGLHMGLNFACEDEAKTFETVWKHSIKDPKSSAPLNEVIPFLLPNLKCWGSLRSKVLKKGKRKKKKVNKVDIGLPSNFQHVEHIGLDSRACAAFSVFLSPPWTLCDDLNLELKQRLCSDGFSLRSVQQRANDAQNSQAELLRPVLEVDRHSEKMKFVSHALVQNLTDEDVIHKPDWLCVDDYFETASLLASDPQHHDLLKETTNLKLQSNKLPVEEQQAVTPSSKDGIMGLILEAMNRRRVFQQSDDSSDEECGEDDEWD
uniref:CRIB domain-containing protein n=1 Tax=Eptatretus burgeri TaxID=7764 RepID=A0A8C4QP31_EPTBU